MSAWKLWAVLLLVNDRPALKRLQLPSPKNLATARQMRSREKRIRAFVFFGQRPGKLFMKRKTGSLGLCLTSSRLRQLLKEEREEVRA